VHPRQSDRICATPDQYSEHTRCVTVLAGLYKDAYAFAFPMVWPPGRARALAKAPGPPAVASVKPPCHDQGQVAAVSC
jgi:hypothetical protein